jgi:hypothetical protein
MPVGNFNFNIFNWNKSANPKDMTEVTMFNLGTFIIPKEKVNDIVSETIELENWWADLSKTEPMTKKIWDKMWAVNDTINKMWKRARDFKK